MTTTTTTTTGQYQPCNEQTTRIITLLIPWTTEDGYASNTEHINLVCWLFCSVHCLKLISDYKDGLSSIHTWLNVVAQMTQRVNGFSVTLLSDIVREELTPTRILEYVGE